LLRPLHIDGPSHCVDDTRKLYQDGITRNLCHPPAVPGHMWVHDLLTKRPPAPKRIDIVEAPSAEKRPATSAKAMAASRRFNGAQLIRECFVDGLHHVDDASAKSLLQYIQ